ncbi:XkdX family protein [Lactobacillus amylovorus]
MFEIYKFEFDNDFISQDELRSYIDMGLITQSEYQEIVGGTNEEAKPVEG